MSWNLLIYKSEVTSQGNRSLGNREAVAAVFDTAFPGLKWMSGTEATLPVEGGFRLELTEVNGSIQDVYTHGGFSHLKELATLCCREGWRMADAQEGEDVDLTDPLRWFEDRMG